MPVLPQLSEAQQDALGRDGFVIVPAAADAETIAALLRALDDVQDGQGVRRRGSIYGIRNLMDVVPEVGRFAASEAVRALVTPVLGAGAFPVRGTLFDKTPDANWNVVWHQDLSIAVQERRDAPGFGPWSEKSGVPHVQPPAAILERLLTLRLHLDPCGEDNGPLRVIAGSHRHGRLDAGDIQERRQHHETVCTVPAGGALLMRPLLLHASSDARQPGHRRVVHLDFAAERLPGGLRWHAERSAAGLEPNEVQFTPAVE